MYNKIVTNRMRKNNKRKKENVKFIIKRLKKTNQKRIFVKNIQNNNIIKAKNTNVDSQENSNLKT